EAARLVKAARGSVALERMEAKARGAKPLRTREHRVADAAALVGGEHVKLIDHVAVEHHQRYDSPAHLCDPGLALRHHPIDQIGRAHGGTPVTGGYCSPA